MVYLSSLLVFLSLLPSSFSRELPILTTKQDIKNIRFISSDGKFTYYQRSNGSLQFSTNYKVTPVIKLAPKTHFNLIVSNEKKYILVEAYEEYHSYFAARGSAKVYLIKYGTAEIQEIGQGKAIGLHLQDKWLSYYDSFNHSLTLQSTLSSNLKHTIKMANIRNPYFIPQATMVDDDTFYYTDINKSGIPGLLRYKLNASEVKLVHKEKSPNQNIEICYKDKLYVMTYGFDPLEKGSQIRILDIEKNQITPQSLYSSQENDIGTLICEFKDHLFFIKTFRSEAGKLTYDAYKVALKDNKESSRVSQIDFATSLIKMDEMLILPYQNKFFLLKGENILTEADQLLKTPQL